MRLNREAILPTYHTFKARISNITNFLMIRPVFNDIIFDGHTTPTQCMFEEIRATEIFLRLPK